MITSYSNYMQARLAQGVDFSIGEAIRRGFQLMGKRAGSYIGFLLVTILISFAASMVSGFIPFVGDYIIGVVLAPALAMGYALYCRKNELNLSPEFGNFFDGFKTNYGQLVLVNLVLQTILGLAALLLVLPFFREFQALLQGVGGNPDVAIEVANDIGQKVLENWVVFVAFFVLVMVIYLLYSLANYFVVFYDFGFWESLEASRRLMSKVFFKTIGFYFVAMLIIIFGGLLTLGFGLLYLAPALYLMQYSVFEQVAGFDETEMRLEDDLII